MIIFMTLIFTVFTRISLHKHYITLSRIIINVEINSIGQNKYTISTMKVLQEWCLEAPWGNIALVSWGNPNGNPILLVHGRQDSLVTFLPLLDLLPVTNHYVAFDLPGHGKSDPFPVGIAVPRILGVSVLEIVIKHLGWKKFSYISHSMGAELGLFYCAIHPNQIQKLIFLDPGPPLLRLLGLDYRKYFEKFYVQYYTNYKKYNVDERVYTKKDAIASVMRNRSMTESQAEMILSRNLIKIGEDKYRLSWDKRLKIMAPLVNTLDYYKELFTKNLPPSLFVCASDSKMIGSEQAKDETQKLLQYFSEQKNTVFVTVKGDHDIHFTNPELFIDEVNNFLRKSHIVSKI